MARRKTSKKTPDYHPVRPQMRPHSSGQARVTLSGKTHYLGRYGSIEAHEKYTDLVRAWERNGRKPLEPVKTVAHLETEKAAPTKSVREAFAEYETYLDETGRYRKNGKPTSERSMLKLAISELVEVCGDCPVVDLDEAMLIAYRDRLERRPRITRKGINRKLQMVKRGLKWMRPRGIITREQWHEIHALEPLKRGEVPADRERRQPKRAVTFAEVEAVAAQAGRVVGAMMRLQALTGMRPGEVCALRWEDIDQEPVTVDGVECWTYRVAMAKTAHHGHETEYALGPAAQAILQQFAAREEGHVFSPRQAMLDRHLELRAQRQTAPTQQMRDRDAKPGRAFRDRYTVDNYAQAVERAGQRTRVARFTPHEIRHGFVTRAARAFGVVAASAAANHRNIATTQGYLHAEREDAFRVVVGLEAAADNDRQRDCEKAG